MKQYTLDGNDNSTLNFNCNIDEEFYVLIQRPLDPDSKHNYQYSKENINMMILQMFQK